MNSEQKSTDRRRHARFELLEYAMVYANPSAEPIRSVVVDISLGGMQIRSRHDISSGSNCFIVIGRGASQPLTVHADATYSHKIDQSDLFATGFRFKPTKERVELVDYVHGVFQNQGDNLTP